MHSPSLSRTPLAAGFALAVALAVLAVAPALASAATLYVAEDGTDVGACTAAAPCLTPQYAVDHATSGDGVQLAAGSYAGPLHVATSDLTIEGNTSTDTTIFGQGTASGVVVLDMGSDGVTLKNLAITGGTNGLYTNATIDQVALTDAQVSDNTHAGVFVAAAAAVTGLYVDGATITGNGTGILVYGELYNPCLCNDHVDGNGVGFASISGDPVHPAVVDGLFASNTTFNNNAGGGLYFEALSNSIWFGTDVRNSGTSSATKAGIDLDLRYADYQNNQMIGGNITGSAGPGLRVRARNQGELATHPATADQFAFGNLNIIGNGTGVSLGGALSRVVIQGNRIVGNTSAGIDSDVDTHDTDAVAAEQNWWGCNSGPGATGCDTVVTTRGSRPVEFDPWVVLAVSASPDYVLPSGTSTITADLTHDSQGNSISDLPDNVPVHFSTTSGTIDPADASTCRCGDVDTTFTAADTEGVATIKARVDHQTVQLSMRVGGPKLTVTPTSVDFGTVVIGTTAPAQTLELRNDGASLMTVTAIERTGTDAFKFRVTAQNCTAGVIAPGETCQAQVVFTPALGEATGRLRIRSDGGVAYAALSGSGSGGLPMVSPASMSFADQSVGTVSSTQRITVINSGDSPLGISALERQGADAFSFKILGQTCANVTIDIGESCTVDMGFAPTEMGDKSGSLRIRTTGGIKRMRYTGRGISAGFGLSPTSLTFGPQQERSASTPQTLTITNDGNDPLTVTAFERGGTGAYSFQVTSQTCTAAPVEPGASCTANVTFKPLTTGAITGSLLIRTNATAVPLKRVQLSGMGTAAG